MPHSEHDGDGGERSRRANLDAIALLCWLFAWPRERGGGERSEMTRSQSTSLLQRERDGGEPG